jgi:acetylornithine deacetylase
LRGDVIVTAVVDEEYGSIGTESIVQQWHADAAIVTEPTELEICTAHKGFVWLDVETFGVAAHGSLPELGVDAIVKMGKVLVELEALATILQSTPPHRLLGNGSVHASLINGGQERSSYPQHCSLSVERRTIPGETAQQVEAELSTLLARIATSDPAFQANVTMGLARDPFEISFDQPIVQTVLSQATRILGHEIPVGGVFGWMDSALLSTAGIPTVIFGPGGEGAHATVEWSDIIQVERCTEILAATAEDFCS